MVSQDGMRCPEWTDVEIEIRRDRDLGLFLLYRLVVVSEKGVVMI